MYLQISKTYWFDSIFYYEEFSSQYNILRHHIFDAFKELVETVMHR